jgi:hypothetical protein
MAVNDNRPYSTAQKELFELQATKNHERYVRADVTGAARDDGGVIDDHDARVAKANATHTVKQNSELTTVNQVAGVNGTPVYTGGNIVNVATNRAGIDAFPEDTQAVEDLEHEVLVKNALNADAIFTTGGPMGDYTGVGSLSDGVDGLWLAEASKQTGSKFF